MNCPKCGYEMGRNRRYCEHCGTDTAVALHLLRVSNRYYNEGLARAQVRDLSGAILMLKKSLESNKRNSNARNLLGLVYYEQGEIVVALSEWIISKHFMQENNPADYFIGKVQANPAKLDAVNQTIKKYNQALAYAKQGSDDLAMLQLRKVISVRPGYVRALQLLALLYMKNGEYEKAKQCLVRAQKTDVANTVTLSYLAETERVLNPDGTPAHSEQSPETISYQPVSPTVSYQEDKPNYIAFVTFFLGIVIGIAVLYWLVVPTVRANVKAEYASKERDFGSEIASYATSISVLENEKKDLEAQLYQAEKTMKEMEEENSAVSAFDVDAYEQVLLTIAEYPQRKEEFLKAKEEKELSLVLEDLIAYAKQLLACEESASVRRKTAAVYENIKDEVVENVKMYSYEYGHELYNAGKYGEAASYLLAVYEVGGKDADTLYFLGRSYQRDGDEEMARLYLQELVDLYPDSERADMAYQCMDGLD